jgi:hypothetical protein
MVLRNVCKLLSGYTALSQSTRTLNSKYETATVKPIANPDKGWKEIVKFTHHLNTVGRSLRISLNKKLGVHWKLPGI